MPIKGLSNSLSTLLLVFMLASCGGGGGKDSPIIDPPLPPLPSSDANLTGLMVSAGSLDQIFQSELLDYTSSVGFMAKAVRLYPTFSHVGAKALVNDIPLGDDGYSQFVALSEGINPVINIKVTAEDGVTVKTYTLTMTRDFSASFAQQAYIKASNTDFNDLFGSAVAVHANTLVIGAPNEQSSTVGINGNEADNSLSQAGAVYVFVRSGGVWSLQAYIKASNTDFADGFGATIAVWGDTLAVGAPGEDSATRTVNGDGSDNSAADSGAVYLFQRTGAGWLQQAYIKASNADAGDRFGSSLTLEMNRLVVGAPFEQSDGDGVGSDQNNNGADNSGAVYVYQRTGTDWSQESYIKASNSDFGDRFGSSLDLSGNTLIIGAPGEDGGSRVINGDALDNSRGDSGAAYMFNHGSGNWTQTAYLKAGNGDAGDLFGSSVAISGFYAVVGSPQEDSAGTPADNSIADSGAAYLFDGSGGTWTESRYIKAQVMENLDRFGNQVDLQGYTLIIGTEEEDSAATGLNGDQTDNSTPSSGAAYAYHYNSGGGSAGLWSVIGYIKASNTEFDDRFGFSLGFHGDALVIGAPFEDSSATGVGGNEGDNAVIKSGAAYIWH